MNAPRDGGERLVYLMGASGSGKDTLLRLLRSSVGESDRIWIAPRTITRPSSADEASIEVSEPEFERLSQAGQFAMQWHSHGLHYGIGIELDDRLARGWAVVVNGSRRYLPEASTRYPAMTAVEITVDPAVLAGRLAARGRETAGQIAERLASAVLQDDPSLPPTARLVRLENNAAPELAAGALLEIAKGLL
jgi:ribose 1,5-bisphosphokinase